MQHKGNSLAWDDGSAPPKAATATAAVGQTRPEPGEPLTASIDPLKNAGAFFGQTTLGATDPFFDAAATTQSYEFHELPIDDFTAVFDRHALGVGSELARTFEVPGQDTAPRAALGAMLDELLGRRARKAELQFWFTFLDFDSNCLITRREWDAAIAALREASASPQQAREYSSYDRWRADKLRERRGAWEPRRAFQAPLTAQQEIGWHAGKPAARLPSDRAKLSSTDVTRREGRTAVTYYGYMNMLGG